MRRRQPPLSAVCFSWRQSSASSSCFSSGGRANAARGGIAHDEWRTLYSLMRISHPSCARSSARESEPGYSWRPSSARESWVGPMDSVPGAGTPNSRAGTHNPSRRPAQSAAMVRPVSVSSRTIRPSTRTVLSVDSHNPLCRLAQSTMTARPVSPSTGTIRPSTRTVLSADPHNPLCRPAPSDLSTRAVRVRRAASLPAGTRVVRLRDAAYPITGVFLRGDGAGRRSGLPLSSG